jgi:hypothetical protein
MTAITIPLPQEAEDFICRVLDEIADPFAIPLPGGIEIEDIDLLKVIQPALTPLVPLFNIIDTVVALFNCIKAIPDAIAGLDPTVLAACIPELAEKLDKLLNMVPQVSLPRLVKRLLLLILDNLERVRIKLLHLQRQMTRILKVVDRATNLDDAGLAAIAVCAQSNVAQEGRNVGKNLASLGRLFGLINLFMGLFGGPQIPDLASLAGHPLDLIIEPLDALINALGAVSDTLPVS